MLRVAIDGRRLQDAPLTGVGRALAGLLPYLAAEVDLTVLLDGRRPTPPSAEAGAVRLGAGMGPLPETAWLQARVPLWLAHDRSTVFHGTFNAVPIASRHPSVVTIHDLSWEDHAEDYGAAKRRAFAVQARWAARHADVIVTVSEFTRAAIMDRYGVAGDRLMVAPNPVDTVFGPHRRIEAEPLLDRLGVRPPFVVALGGARRRALPVAVEAWRQATAAMGTVRPQLVVVGAEQPPPEAGLVTAGRLGDEDWARLLAAAEAFCYPTRFEGFGLPALEAVASGTPVVCAPVASLPEVLGEAAEWAASPAAPDIAAALSRLLVDPDRREQLRAASLERAAAAPGWEEVAATVVTAYERAAG